MSNPLTKGVYYIYCKNNWKEVVEEQVQAIEDSNILNLIDSLYVITSGNVQEDFTFTQSRLAHTKVKHYSIKNNTQFEFPALKLISDICKSYDCKVFYMHTKGVSISEENMQFYHGSKNLNHLYECVRDWRQMMEYFLLYNTEHNIKLLDSYDACGVNLIDTPHPHFSGNFWWSKSSYINKLPSIDTLNTTFRWNAEFWLGFGKGNFYSHYFEPNAGYTKRITVNYKK